MQSFKRQMEPRYRAQLAKLPKEEFAYYPPAWTAETIRGNLKRALEAGRLRLPDSDSLQADLVRCG
jgi:hypothetical protein